MIHAYTESQQAAAWCQRYRGQRPLFACVLGFTETGLVPGISAAGSTPDSRRLTAVADAEFLVRGPRPDVRYPLPSLQAGVSPVFIARALLAQQQVPMYLLDAGLPLDAAVPIIALGGAPARCLSTGQAQNPEVVRHLFVQGLSWGEKLSAEAPDSYVILAECVVGGTTTALAVLTGLGVQAQGKVNSSHAVCNHAQKWALVQTGLARLDSATSPHNPWAVVTALGDPMQIALAGLLLSASRTSGVLLAGGTQMLAVYALARAIALQDAIPWNPENVVVGTTRWVAEDPSGDTPGLAMLIGQVPLLATQLNFERSRYPKLRAYEQGFVKEGVGAGGCAIAAHLYQNWTQTQMLDSIESLIAAYEATLKPE